MQISKKMAVTSPSVCEELQFECVVLSLQVDLVGADKLNNSLGFSMFFVGLGCLTGPPLAGEWITSWKTFRSQTCVNPLFHMHTITNAYIWTACAWDCSHDVTVLRWFVTKRTRWSLYMCSCLFLCVWGTYIFFGGCCSTYFHGALNSLQCFHVCVCVSVCVHAVTAECENWNEKNDL